MPVETPAGVAVVTAASRGIGRAIAKELLARHPKLQVVAAVRDPSKALEAFESLPSDHRSRLSAVQIDLKNEKTIDAAAAEIRERFGEGSVRLLYNVAGVLTAEKSLQAVTPESLLEHFQVNAFGAILTTKHFAGKKLLYSAQPRRTFESGPVSFDGSIVANMSARTGSIGDNRLGGWYSYRASKAALNMLTVTSNIELSRKNTIAVALHPGTVETDMSRNFVKGVKHAVFTPEEAAGKLLDVVAKLGKEDGGAYLDFKGDRIPW